MRLTQQLRNPKYATCARGLAVLLAASALLVARNSAPKFSGPTVHAAATGSHHEPRQRFDDNMPRCPEPAIASVLALPSEVRATVAFATALVPAFQTAGAHYNRPPPVS